MGLWASWSPEDWGQGKKMQPRGEKSCYIAPDDYLAWHKIQVEKKVGRELEDRGYVPKWTEILARDFALSYRDQNGKDQLIWISPEGARYVANKNILDNILAGSGRATTINLPQEVLVRTQAAQLRLL